MDRHQKNIVAAMHWHPAACLHACMPASKYHYSRFGQVPAYRIKNRLYSFRNFFTSCDPMSQSEVRSTNTATMITGSSPSATQHDWYPVA